MKSSLVPAPLNVNYQLSNETSTLSATGYAQLDNDELIEACFRNHYQFMSGSHELESIYSLFKTEAYQRLALRGVSNDEAEYLLRSGRFVYFVKNLIASPKNESLTTPSASTPGNDEEETSAIVSCCL